MIYYAAGDLFSTDIERVELIIQIRLIFDQKRIYYAGYTSIYLTPVLPRVTFIYQASTCNFKCMFSDLNINFGLR